VKPGEPARPPAEPAPDGDRVQPARPAPAQRGGRSSLGETARTYAPDFLQEMFANPLDAGYADAAARRERDGAPRPGTRRTGFGLRTLSLVLIGVLFAVAYHQTVAAKPEQSKVQAGLVGDVRARQSTTDELERQANTLREQVTKLRNSALDSSAARALTNLEAGTGLAKVNGDGVVVTMSDGPAPVNPVTNQREGDNLGQVLDLDLQTVVNELWRDGAAAVAINNQRLTSTSAIRRAGNAILVDFVPLSEPYQIAAIGPKNLGAALRDSPTGAQYQRFTSTYGMHFTIAPQDNMSLPAAPDPQLRYATTPSTPSPSPPSPSPSGGR
jgi:uncharacterized protein YlxW (UPF0749 family)